MASEQAFWKNFCDGIDRPDLFERWPGSTYADHATGNLELQRELRDLFRTRTTAEWITFSTEVNTPIAPVNDAATVRTDPQFRDRFPLLDIERVGAEQLPLPVNVVGEDRPVPTMAPTVGQHNDEVLSDVLGYDADRVAEIRDAGALG